MRQYMQGHSYNAEAHTIRRLLDHFGDDILINNRGGIQNLITFRWILFDTDETFTLPASKAERKAFILKTAAEILRKDILDVQQSTKVYPEVPSKNECMDYLPPSMQLFMNTISPPDQSNVNKATFGQSMRMMVRSSRGLIPPILLGPLVQLEHQMSQENRYTLLGRDD